jgi:hypothetical protein
MKVTDLSPQFLQYEKRGDNTYLQYTDDMTKAQGVMFLCPKCFVQNNGKIGTHCIICWSRSRGTPEDVAPLPGRWSIEGTSMEKLTLNGDAVGGGGARSVVLTGGCEWHGFITNGEVTDA